MEILDLGLAGVVAYGGVGVISYLLAKYAKKVLDPEVKFALLVVLAFAVLFVPVELANDLLEKIKVAVAVAVGIHALHTYKKV